MAHLFRRFGPSVWQVRSKKAAFKGRKIGDQMDRRKIIKRNREVDMGSRHEAQRLNGEQFCIMK